MTRAPLGISQGNFAVFVPLIFVCWAQGLSIATTLLILGTVGFAAMLIEPPALRWLASRRKTVTQFVFVPVAHPAPRPTLRRDVKPATSPTPNPTPTPEVTEGK